MTFEIMENPKKSSNEVSFVVDRPHFELSYSVKIRAFLLRKKLFPEKP